jgi:CubicO group peptidase (beta-lactamase class C family)
LKKKFIVFAIAFIVVFSSFVLNNYSEKINAEQISVPANSLDYNEDKKPRLIEKYSETEVIKVKPALDSLLQRINKRHDFHGAILVAKNKKILYKNQIGYADFRKKQPLNDESVFQLASVSKQFTAAAIMLLYEREKIKLSDTVTNYFSDFPYENVTIRNLLNHTAGLPKYFWVAEHKWKQKQAPTNSEMMSLLASSNVQRFFKPGRNFDYSNTGYLVLASIVEKVSGKSFGEFVKENIFTPLGMENSFVYSSENDILNPNQLFGYRLYRGWRHLKINSSVNDAVVGDKNIYSTTEDLFKWTLGLNQGKLLSKESLNLMYSKGETIYGRKIPYGFGFRINPQNPNIIYHYGKWNGFSTGLTQYLKDDLVVIILEHSSYNAMKSLNAKIKKIVSDNFTL